MANTPTIRRPKVTTARSCSGTTSMNCSALGQLECESAAGFWSCVESAWRRWLAWKTVRRRSHGDSCRSFAEEVYRATAIFLEPGLRWRSLLLPVLQSFRQQHEQPE